MHTLLILSIDTTCHLGNTYVPTYKILPLNKYILYTRGTSGITFLISLSFCLFGSLMSTYYCTTTIDVIKNCILVILLGS